MRSWCGCNRLPGMTPDVHTADGIFPLAWYDFRLQGYSRAQRELVKVVRALRPVLNYKGA
jgi:hypothetical protein